VNERQDTAIKCCDAWNAFPTNDWRDNDYTRTARWAESVPIKNNCLCSLKQRSLDVCFSPRACI